ncbi:hypothetical protein [Aquibium oceanicum]|nr:hypothetical protein [Aquibium oceanicum]
MAKLPVTLAAIAAAITLTAIPIASMAGSGSPMDGISPPPLAASPEARVQASQAPSLELCGKRDSMVADLGQQFREQSLATGLVDENAMMEIFVSPSGTWTILATGTDGISCVLAVGEGFEANTQIAGLGV